jgi:hypothetical protein
VATTPFNTPVSVVTMSNDLSPSGAALSVVGTTPPAHGTASCTAAGVCTYTPASGFSGTDSFTYTLHDPFGQSATATVHVTVTPPVFTVTSSPGAPPGTPTSPHLPSGGTLALTFTSGGTPVAASAVSCTGSDDRIATVDGSGNVHAITPGTVTVSCAYNGQTRTITVTVYPPGFTGIGANPAPAGRSAGTTGTGASPAPAPTPRAAAPSAAAPVSGSPTPVPLPPGR